MPGPAPKPDDQRARRNARPAKVYLPAAGRPGKPPVWPLPDPNAYELTLWAELWTLPQAVAWEEQRATRVVAQYVRWQTLSDLGSVKAAPEARMLGDRLGMTPLALRRLEWEIVADPAAAQSGRPTSPAGPQPPAGGSTVVVDARARFGDLLPAGSDPDAAPGAGA